MHMDQILPFRLVPPLQGYAGIGMAARAHGGKVRVHALLYNIMFAFQNIPMGGCFGRG